MDVSLAEAQTRLPQLIRAVEQGEPVVITHNGKPVAQLTTPLVRQPVRLGRLCEQIHLPPGWNEPVDVDRFLTGEL